jgi:hypothetical protein
MRNFENRYALAEGYPWALGTKDYTAVEMRKGTYRIYERHFRLA